VRKAEAMLRDKFLFFLVVGFLILSFLAACGSPMSSMATPQGLFAPTSTASSSLEHVDWSNFTYTFTCYSDHPITVKVKNGSAELNHVHYSVQKPVFGDLMGNGQKEAVIRFQCSAADVAPAQVFVYAGTAQHPHLLATLPTEDRPWFSVQQVRIPNRTLKLSGYGYKLQDPLCCPSLWTTRIYRWNGSRFVVIATYSSPLAKSTS
jgi:hypothetical protein